MAEKRHWPFRQKGITVMDTINSVQGSGTASIARQLINKVPEVTIYFWVIKVLCTTVGETFSDFLDGRFNLGTANLAYIFGGLLLIVLFFQFKKKIRAGDLLAGGSLG